MRRAAGALVLAALFAAGPAAAVPASKPEVVEARSVTARDGDTLARLARRVGVPVPALAIANDLDPGATLKPGQRLRVPAGRVHEVKAGEAGERIARAYGVPWPALAAANGLARDAQVRTGQRLFVPGVTRVAEAAEPDRPLTLEERARRFAVDIEDLLAAEAAPKRRPQEGRTRDATKPPEPARKGAREPVEENTAEVRPTPTRPAAASGLFAWPVEGRQLLSGFGPKPGGRFNDGINVAATSGSPVRAAADGTIAYAGDAVAGFGNLVLIRHAGGWVTAYAHLDRILAGRGSRVRRGEIIGRAGDTGDVAEPQLHFQVRRDRKPVDPMTLLSR